MTTTKLLLTLTLSALASAHGYVKSILADGQTYRGYSPDFQWTDPSASIPGWSMPQNIQLGFINNYASPDIACHLAATPGKAYATVRAGGSITLEWTPWPDSHKGPVIDYLASCNGDCTTVDKTSLLWNKIAQSGLIDGSSVPGKYATDILVAAGNKWTITIPSSIAPGNYVLRHEIIALHQGGQANGAQSYPQCINLQVTGSGSTPLNSVGTRYDKLYTATDPGILFDIYRQVSSYPIPGPALFVAGGGAQSSSPSTSVTTTSSRSGASSTMTGAGTVSSTSTSRTTSVPSTLQTSTRATTTIAVTDASTRTSASAGTAETGTFYLNSNGKVRKFVCVEEL